MEPEKVTPNLGIIKQSVTTIKKRGENGTSILFHSLLKAIEGVCVKQNNLIGTPFNRYLSFNHTFPAFGNPIAVGMARDWRKGWKTTTTRRRLSSHLVNKEDKLKIISMQQGQYDLLNFFAHLSLTEIKVDWTHTENVHT